jgi:hypothetical protein
MKLQKIIYSIFILFVFTVPAGCTSDVDSQVTGMALFPERHGFDLKLVSISDAASNTLDFKRVDCVWVIGEANKPSNEPKVTALADRLVNLAPKDLVTQKRDRYKDFNVGDDKFNHKVVLTFKDGKSFSLLIGTPALTKPVYVRLANRNTVYSVNEPLLKQINLDTGSWLAPEEVQ